eukprot:4493911-Amphidinium_carterae.1
MVHEVANNGGSLTCYEADPRFSAHNGILHNTLLGTQQSVTPPDIPFDFKIHASILDWKD